MMQLRPWISLSGGDYQWLKAKHHFPFDGSNNPDHTPLGCLVVWNDDEIEPHTGFPLHGHRDMEIVTYVREGTVRHEDNSGGQGEITAGNVQAFSAGVGIRHAEFNPGDVKLKIFQIWLTPRKRGITPRWATKPFPKAERMGHFVALASGFAEDHEALQIEADARVLGATIQVGQQISYPLAQSRHAYLVPARGSIAVNGQRVGTRDGIAISNEATISIVALEDSELVLVDAG
jgi:quercetin 2,3-dioxygenase